MVRKRHLAVTAALMVSVGSLSSPVIAHAAASTSSTSTSSTSTFYVGSDTTTCSDSTTDSAVTPYCTIQPAVDQATSPGDTVLVSDGTYPPFTVRASGTAAAPITIVSADGDHLNLASIATKVQTATGATALTVDGASYVDIEGFSFTATQTVVDVSGSASHVTLDSDRIIQSIAGPSGPAVVLGSGASSITLSRNQISSFADNSGTVTATGGSGDVFTTNRITGSSQGPGILLSGTTGTDVTGNTFSAGCGSDLAVVSGSTGTSIENNDLSGLTPNHAGCSVADSDAAVLKVDAASVTGTSADYNDVYPSYPADSALANYSWAGTQYGTASAFAAATGQGIHDANAGGNAAIDSADSSAPGELSTDVNGNPRVDDPVVANTGAGTYGYYDRGATETQDPIAIVRASSWPTQMPLATPGTFAASVADNWAGAGIASCTYDFGDGSPAVTVAPANGTCSTQHTYSVAGGYTIQLVAQANDGAKAKVTARISASGTNQLLPKVSIQQYTSREALISDSGYHGWNILRCVVDFGDGTSYTATDGTCNANHTYAAIGTFTVTITETDSGGNVASATGDFTATGYYFNPTAPTRVLDTRKGIGVPTVAKVAPGGVVKLQLAGTNGISGDSPAVTMNVTVTNATSGGYLTVYPDGKAAPTVSNLNFTAGAVVPNVVVATLGADGAVDIKNSSAGTVDVVADLEGYYAVTGETYDVGTASRLIDTRTTNQTIPANGTLRVNLEAPSSFTAATLNVTVTNSAAGGYLTAYPDGTTAPTASNLNFTPHQTVANEVVVKIGSDGYVDFKNASAGPVDLIVDYNGDFETSTAGAAYTPITPTRFLDTRNGTGDFQASVLPSGALPAFGTGLLYIAGETKIPGVPANAIAGTLNITVTGPTSGGYITAYPSNQMTRPIGSVLNFSAGQTIANAASMLIDESGLGGVDLYNGSGGSVQLVVDVFGYYS